jgi:hypothetical protein
MRGLWSQFAFSLRISLLVAMATAVTAGVVAIRRRRARRPVLAPTSRVLAVGCAMVVVTAMSLPHTWPPQWEGIGDLVLAPGRGGLSDWRVLIEEPNSLAAVLLVANVLLYIPLSLFSTLAWPGIGGPVLLGCLALSLLVELVQLVLLGRVASVDDVLLNMAGAVIGHAIGVGLLRYRDHRSPRAVL